MSQTLLPLPGYHPLSRRAPESWRFNPRFWAAYRRGWNARAEAVCPYPDIRGGRSQTNPTYSRAWRRFWREGHEDGRAGHSRYA